MAWLIFLILCIFFPVAVYCFLLALINRRRHPTMISGSWDFAGVLFALSGFLLIGGPLILTGLNQTFRNLWLQSESAFASAVGEYWWYIRLAFWALYFGAIAAGSIWLLWTRSRTTSIYNVDSPAFDETLAEVLNRFPLKWARAGNRLFIAFPASTDSSFKSGKPPLRSSEMFETALMRHGPPNAPAGVAGSGDPALSERPAQKPAASGNSDPEIMSQESTSVVCLDPFPAMRHVTLQWPREARQWRQEIEAELVNTLREVHSPDNPAALWFLSIGSTLFCLIFFALALLVFLSLLRPTG